MKDMTPEMKERIKELQEKVKKAAEDYYNSIESMSNFEYDRLYDELKALEEEYELTERVTSSVGASVQGGLKKVRHEFEAKSLGKTKSVADLIKEQSKTSDGKEGLTCLSWKLDGCTCQLTYENGKLILAATRGDGSVGQDITKNAAYIEGIPATVPFQGRFTVRGEALMSYAEFEHLNTDGQFANPRNLASATITALDETLLTKRHITFKAFELVDIDAKGAELSVSFSERLAWLRSQGFGVVEHEKVKLTELEDRIGAWSKSEKINAYGYPVDGLVVSYDDTSKTKDLAGTGHHPSLTKAMAFKWQDETMETVLRKIEWSASRTGLLNPVAVFDTVDLCGTRVSRASLHNVSYVEGLNLKVGDRITVYKANMIIPQIAENLDKEKAGRVDHNIECPCCHSQAVIEEKNGVKTAVCENEACLAKELGAFVRYAEKHGTNIEGLSEKTLLMLMEKGYLNDIADLYKLEEHPEIATIPGFGKKSYENLLQSIEKAKDMDLEHFLYACGIENIGRGQLKEIIGYLKENYEDLCGKYLKQDAGSAGENMFYLLLAMTANGFDFTQINGIGSVLAENFANFLDEAFLVPMKTHTPGRYADCLPYINLTDQIVKKKTVEAGDSQVAGKTVVITGSLEHFKCREELAALIEEMGGKVSGSVSKNTSYLINNDMESTSGKNKKAKELGIPIISEDAFLEEILGIDPEEERDR